MNVRRWSKKTKREGNIYECGKISQWGIKIIWREKKILRVNEKELVGNVRIEWDLTWKDSQNEDTIAYW